MRIKPNSNIVIYIRMKLFIMCGGNGSRMKDYSFPKPLNMIYGKPSIYYTLSKLPKEISELHFIVAPHLLKFNFCEIITNLFPSKSCIFHNLPYFTRGAAESAWLGSSDIDNDSSENIIFLDNDVLFTFPECFLTEKPTSFIGYDIDETGTEAYSFLKIDASSNVIEYKEKIRISDKYCCGVYGFKNIKEFRDGFTHILTTHTTGELYMSNIFTYLLNKEIPIHAMRFENALHIGSLSELHTSIHRIPIRKMRVCFDLDNTLVTYPTVYGDYRTVKPIAPMIDLVRKLKSQGHTIIIHTARRMHTHQNNVGAVIRDIGMITMQTLADLDIPYDELIFGKPIADMYIDDRAINPYRNDMNCMGIVDYTEKETPVNMLPTNKYNSIDIVGNMIRKRGPIQYISGEQYYYSNIPRDSSISTYFPAYYGSKQLSESLMDIYIENIRGIPLYTLYKACLLTDSHINDLFVFIDLLHNTHGANIPPLDKVKENYTEKLRARFSVVEDYPFEDAAEVQELVLRLLDEYYLSDIHIVSYIHGDLWLSNILLDHTNKIKCIDMKGKVNDMYTTGGDVMYDYGKLFQSVLGYDVILYGDNVPLDYMQHIKQLFLTKISERGITERNLMIVCFSLIIGTLHSIKSSEKKQQIWQWIKDIFITRYFSYTEQ